VGTRGTGEEEEDEDEDEEDDEVVVVVVVAGRQADRQADSRQAGRLYLLSKTHEAIVGGGKTARAISQDVTRPAPIAFACAAMLENTWLTRRQG